MDRERISLLNIPLDIVGAEEMNRIINEFLLEGGARNIVLLSLWDLLRARRNVEYRTYLMEAALVIPISKSLVAGGLFLTGKKLVRYMPFDFIISLLSIVDRRELSVYLIGGRQKALEKAESNVRQTFPHLHIIGRHSGHFKKHIEGALLEAIRKASPSLLLAGTGVHGEELWIHRNVGRIGNGLRLWCSDIVDVFANKRRHPSRYSFDHGLEWIGFCFRNPLRIFRLFLYLYYCLLLILYRLFRRKPAR
jgi:N-acetylglucosaminyldiphosphoundecaprenol N-acetyl-beta-D-mannosaminyltransferase